MRRIGAFVTAMGLALVAWGQEDEEAVRPRDYLEEEHALSMAFETPHTDWATPYGLGTTRAVFFAPWYQGGMECREIVEWMQRFELDAEAVYWMKGGALIGDNNPNWYGGDAEAGTKRALRLIAGTPDVFVMNQMRPGDLPDKVRDALIEAVRGGAGLLVIGGDVISLEGLSEAVADAMAPDGSYFMLGDGRVAQVAAREALVYGIGWETAYDYQVEAQGRALLWAAGMLPAGRVTVNVPERVDRDGLPAEVVRVSWEGVAGDARARVVLRRWDGEAQPLADETCGGRSEIRVVVPPVRAGAYHVDVVVRRGERVETWATQMLRVDAEHDVTLMLARDWAEVGETIEGTVEAPEIEHSSERVVVRLGEMHGRVLDEQTVWMRNGEGRFSFDVHAWTPSLVRIDAVIQDGKGEAASDHALATVTNRNRDRFNFVMWNYAGGDLAPYSVQSLAAHGVTAILQGGNAPSSFAESSVSFVPYAASFRASSHTTTAMLDPETGALKTGCVHDDAKMNEIVRDAVEHLRESRELGVLAYSLGDENAVRASCLSPQCLAAYRAYLREMYDEIDALNAEWGSDYGEFGAIELLDDGPLPAPDAPAWFEEYFAEWDLLHRTDNEGAEGDALDRQVAMGAVNEEMRALQSGNFARWYDRQSFQNWSYVQWCKRYQAAFDTLDPEAWTGFEGTDSFSIRRLTTRSRQGGDLDAFVRELDYFGPYKGPANEVVRSIAPKGFPMGNWIGYEPEAGVLLQLYWDQVCDRMNTVQWWRWDNLSGYHGYLMPTLAPFPAVEALIEDTQVVRDGLGTVLMDAEMQTDGVAMLYSLPSTYIQHFDGNPSYGDYDRDHDRWHRLIHDAGLQFEYVTDRMVRLGEFDASRYKVLILPLAYAMTAEEAEVIRGFVAAGGTVIADLRPAIYDGHCKPLGEGQLDDVFGIRRTGNREARGIDRMRIDSELDGHPVKMEWGNWHGKNIYPQMLVDPNVEVTTGEPLGAAYHIHYWVGLQSPMGVVNTYGKGRAILLNFSAFDAPMGGLLRDVLASSGVAPVVRVTDLEGRAVQDVEISRFMNGDEEIVMLLGSHEGDVRVTLPGRQVVYDVKRRLLVGETDSFEATVRAHRASVFALRPEVAAAPQVRADGRVRRGAVLTLRVSIPELDASHPVKISLTDNDGVESDGFAKTLVAGKGVKKVELPVGVNDAAGMWRVRATDVFTGLMDEIEVKVK